MKRLLVKSVFVVAVLLAYPALADDKPMIEIAPSGKPGLYNFTLDNVPLEEVIHRMSTLTNLNIIIPMLDRNHTVTCHLTEVPLLPAVTAMVEMAGCVMEERQPGSGVLCIRRRTPGELRAGELRSFFNALKKEGFTEDQSMQILLRSIAPQGSKEED